MKESDRVPKPGHMIIEAEDRDRTVSLAVGLQPFETSAAKLAIGCAAPA